MNRRTFFFLLIISVVTFVSFAPALKQSFLNWDDPVYVTNDPYILGFDRLHLKEILTAHIENIYVPLTLFTFALEKHSFGFNPFFFHLDNLFLHLAVSILAFFFARRLGLTEIGSFLGALIFAVHPMHVESVVWISERKDVLYSFFYLLALLAYANYVRNGKRWGYWSSLVLGALSLLAKPMAVSLPLILLWCDWYWGRKRSAKLFLEKIPHLALAVGIGWITYSMHRTLPVQDFQEALLLFIWSFGFHIQKYFVPYPLLALYQTPQPIGFANPAYAAFAAFFLALTLSCWILRHHRLWVFALGYYTLSVFFLLKTYARLELIMVADHYMYLPSLGFCLLIGSNLSQWLTLGADEKDEIKKNDRGLWFRSFGLGIFMGGLCLMTVGQTALWGNELKLWNRVLQFFPSSIAHDNIGSYYTATGEFDAAIREHTVALEIIPREDARIYTHRGLAFAHKGELAQAIADYNEGLRFDPNYRFAYFNRAIAYDLSGQNSAALADYNKLLEFQPRNYLTLYLRAILHHRMGDNAAALRDLDATIAVYPDFFSAYFIRGQLLYFEKSFGPAIKDLTRAIELNPAHAGARYKRALAFQAVGKTKEAQEDIAQALKLAPERNDIRQSLGNSKYLPQPAAP